MAIQYFIELGRGDKAPFRIGCDTLAKASAVLRGYIDDFGLGSGCGALEPFTGGKVFDAKAGGTQLARISYNGRVWNLDGTEIDLAPVTHIWVSKGVPEGMKFHALADAEAFAAVNKGGRIVPAGEFVR